MTLGRRERILLVTAVGLALVAIWVVWSRARSDADRGVVTEAVDRGDIAATVTATGTVNPVTTVQVGTYVSGPIRAIDVDFNSKVTKGQRVAKIDPAPFQVKVDQASASLANARAKVEKSRADLGLKRLTRDRNRELRGRNLISQSELDTAESDLAQAAAQLALDEAGVKQAQAALDEARIQLGYTDIISPVDGVVVSRNVDVGQTVAASFQTPTLFLIAQDLTQMQVNANVSESDIGGVHEGQTAAFSVDAYPDKVFSGTVSQVRNAPKTLQNVVTYDVVIQVDNASLELKPGMTATVTITTDRRDDVVRVPVRALRFRPEEPDAKAAPRPAGRGDGAKEPPAVWVVGSSGELRKVELQTGLRNDRFAEVVGGGIEPGDAVVVAYERPATNGNAPAAPSPLGGVRRPR